MVYCYYSIEQGFAEGVNLLTNNSPNFSEMVDEFFKILRVVNVKLIPNSVLKHDASETIFSNLRGVFYIDISNCKDFLIDEFCPFF
jgi:hypothetical protein